MHITCVGGFGNLKQDCACLQVSDLKAYKVDVINIILGFTEVPCNNEIHTDVRSLKHWNDLQAIVAHVYKGPIWHAQG